MGFAGRVAPRHQKPKPNRREERVNVALSIDELRELVGAAAGVGETLAEYVRNAAFHRARAARQGAA